MIRCLQGTWALRPNYPYITIRVTLLSLENCNNISGNDSQSFWAMDYKQSTVWNILQSSARCLVLTLPVPRECNHLSLTGVGNRHQGAFWYSVLFPSPIFACSLITPVVHHYDLYRPDVMDRCRDKRMARRSLLWMRCQSPTTGTGQRMGLGRPWPLLGMLSPIHCSHGLEVLHPPRIQADLLVIQPEHR